MEEETERGRAENTESDRGEQEEERQTDRREGGWGRLVWDNVRVRKSINTLFFLLLSQGVTDCYDILLKITKHHTYMLWCIYLCSSFNIVIFSNDLMKNYSSKHPLIDKSRYVNTCALYDRDSINRGMKWMNSLAICSCIKPTGVREFSGQWVNIEMFLMNFITGLINISIVNSYLTINHV